MPVLYNSKKIIPAPFISINKDYNRTGDTHKVGSNFTITVQGTLHYCKGSPNSAGQFYDGSGYPPSTFQSDIEEVADTDKRMKSLQGKMLAIRNLFAQDGKAFEAQPLDGSAPIKCYPIVENISFEDGDKAGFWHDYVKYTITLSAKEIFGLDTAYNDGAEDYAINEDFFKDDDGAKLYLNDVSESWNLEMQEESQNETNQHLFRLTHNLSATGIRHYDDGGLVSEGWQQAKRWVDGRMGLDTSFFKETSALNLGTDFLAYNHVRSENTDELAGTYSVTESWIISKSNYKEDFTINVRTSQDSGLTSVNIDGTIQGYETVGGDFDNPSESAWTAALAKYDDIKTTTIFSRAQSYSGLTLNSKPLSSTVGRSVTGGRINYSYEYNNRPTDCIANSIFERITIADVDPGDVFASIPVVGRSAGPVLQDMSTVTERQRTVSVEVIMPVNNVCPNSAANVATILSNAPTSEVSTIITAFQTNLESNYTQVFKKSDTPNWDFQQGRYSRSVTWTFQ